MRVVCVAGGKRHTDISEVDHKRMQNFDNDLKLIATG